MRVLRAVFHVTLERQVALMSMRVRDLVGTNDDPLATIALAVINPVSAEAQEAPALAEIIPFPVNEDAVIFEDELFTVIDQRADGEPEVIRIESDGVFLADLKRERVALLIAALASVLA
jgi:hypothetical protein